MRDTEYGAPDIDVTRAERSAGSVIQSFVDFTTIRALPGSASGAFSFGAHASRPASGAIGDQYLSTDRGTIYFYTGTLWKYSTGVNSGTNAVRAAIAVTANDDGTLFFTNDQNKLWRVEGGVWVDKFVTLDLTTSIKIAGTKVIGAQGAAVADAASADATDLATAITLVNELKGKVNTLLARVRAHGLIS